MSILNLFVHRLFVVLLGPGGYSVLTLSQKTSKYKVTKNPSRKKDPIPKVKLINVARQTLLKTLKHEALVIILMGKGPKNRVYRRYSILKATMDIHTCTFEVHTFRQCNKIHQLHF